MHEINGLLLAALLILLNGFFVAAEFALVRLRSTHARTLAQEHGLRGRILMRMHHRLDAYLSATQLGITIASLGIGWVGEPTVARLLQPLFRAVGVTDPTALRSVSFAIGFALISFIVIVIGELVPKSLAIRKVEAVSLWTGAPLYAFYWLMYPAIWVLNGATRIVLRLFALRVDQHAGDAPHSRDELAMILALSQAQGTLGQRTGDILDRTLDFTELTAGDLMRPAAEMVCLMLEDSPEEIRQVMMRHRFTRYPVCEGDRQHVVGLLHVKDAFATLSKHPDLGDLKTLLRPLPSVGRALPAMDLLTHFRSGHPHFALVVDDLGTITGFVTLDHVLESLLGAIPDEFRHQRREWRRRLDGSWVGSGSLSLYSLERSLHIDIDEETADTIGGLVMHQLERVPEEGERIAFPNFDVVVLRKKGPRITLVQVIPHPDQPESDWFS
ncbi:hemolysin family protein [Acidithiobacillus sp.]|uniref:hemolysin family protein n=1 Tax=Acidithiobacillus sp. TaxID=1872118 RepID=UPI0025C40C9B|nr:hemolysin family protein [Acidithiobacillus sp.]